MVVLIGNYLNQKLFYVVQFHICSMCLTITMVTCMACIGWINGHSYVVYGPLSNGATTVLFESIPTYPDPGE